MRRILSRCHITNILITIILTTIKQKIPTNGSRYVPNGYYTPNGRTSATDGGSPMSQQPSLYPSPPVQPHGGEETSYSKPYSSMLYMNGDHVPPPPTIGFASHTESTLSNLYGASLGGDHYQPYGLPAMGYEEVTPAYPTAGHPPMELPMGQAPKYDAWSTESAVLQPVLSPMGFPVISHAQSLAIKQEYASPTYISPSPSSMAGGSSIKTELMSDSSRSPPPPGLADQQLQGLAIPPPLPSSACSSPSLLPLPQTKQESKPNVKLEDTTGGKKATRNSNNYGDQYACPECRRTFARQCGLTQHTKWHHSGEKPFRCLTCGKCFSAQNALDDHLQRHTTTDKPYQCQQCPKAFFHKNDLRRHGFQHTGKAPHACRYCGKTFARKDHCHSHECSHERKIQRKERKVKGGGVTRDQGVHSVEILSGAPVTPSLDATTLTPVSEMGMHFLGVEHRIGA
uniref:C2H2-type domain-containing protein n=1 Tax=Anopheles epiroticus TaxID=199890 RepID=A0A182P623_9DIPT